MRRTVNGWDIHGQVQALVQRYPQLRDRVDPARIAEQQRAAVEAADRGDDFGTSAEGGRGESYVLAQQSIRTRLHGIDQLTGILTARSRAESDVVLDLLGGDGLVERVMSLLGKDKPLVITCDASPFMVEAAWAQGIAALLQRAETLLFRDASVGGVLLAYGTHHIPVADRQRVADEAFRVVQPGGVFVLHDFPTGSPVDTWFSKVVDVYSATGHDHRHFEREETESYLRSAGFGDVELLSMDDSFVVSGPTREQAELELGRYLVNMYGLVGLVDEYGPEHGSRRAFELACDTFRYDGWEPARREVRVAHDAAQGAWTAAMPREALVGVGRKPATAGDPA
ncbi:class I SAM-dependent methyltransferase [Micromonospora sediminicola]|uniref:class I SAM-dependent methyltransferase n=1 Tax=Micromonospora sediminicola TaxID=946078 RepID=UPI0033BC881F